MAEDRRAEAAGLLARRDAARAARDFALADELRDAIAALGFRVVDGPDGSSLEVVAGSADPVRTPTVRAADVPSVTALPDLADVSLQWVVEGWPEDVLRGIEAFRRHHPDVRMQFVVVDLVDTDVQWPDDVEVVRLADAPGWGSARNVGLRRARASIVVVLDGSIEPTGNVLGPLIAALSDGGVGVAGPFGIDTRDLRAFEESDGPEVDAIEAYCMAMRREVVLAVGGFDERFRFYRSADIDLSFRVRDRGLRAVVVPVPVLRHEHRMWHATPPAQRDAASKRNYYRFLERFRGRTDLTSAARAGVGEEDR